MSTPVPRLPANHAAMSDAQFEVWLYRKAFRQPMCAMLWGRFQDSRADGPRKGASGRVWVNCPVKPSIRA